jgi:ribosomal protein L11 methyltransferase
LTAETPLVRVSVRVPAALAEERRARMIELFPEGFEEADAGDAVELAGYAAPDRAQEVASALGAATVEEVEPGWSESWKAFFRPVRIGSLWLGPPWEEPDPGEIAVAIEPGRAFGTGTHPTTRLCLELLVERPPGSALDVGCGSGVLAIAAAKLGFVPVYAVDIEQAAVEATLANAAVNGVGLEVRLADARVDELPAADLALANLELRLLEQVVPRLRARAVIASGILASERTSARGWRTLLRCEADGWAAELLVPRRAAGVPPA